MFELARRNRTRSMLLVGVMVLLLTAVGFFCAELISPHAGPVGVAVGASVALLLFLVSYFQGDAILLRIARARRVDKSDAPRLYNIVEEMVIASGLGSMPQVYVIEDNVANAFATGRDPEHASVAVTEGLLNLCTRDELQAVVAHEIAHVKHRDILFMTLLSAMVGSIALMADLVSRHLFYGGGRRRSRSSNSDRGGQAEVILMLVGLLFVVIGPIAARMVAMAASRTREYLADAGGAIFTRNPEALASALEKISNNARGHRLPLPRAAQPMLIVGASLFSTHPPVDKRIAVLRAMAGVGGGLSIAGYARGYRSIVGGSTSFIPSVGFVAAPSPSSARGPAADETPGALRREALDALKRGAGYRRVHCPCSAVIKVPATFPRGRSATCVSCGRKLSVDGASE